MNDARWARMVLVAAGLAMLPASTYAQGVVLPGTGAVNRSMAGTGVAAPIDAAGAIHWNPGSLSGLERNEFSVSVELLQLDSHLTSSAGFGAVTGETRSDSGLSPLPSVAVAFKPCDSRWSYGLGLFAVGGFGVNYPGNLENPVQSPLAGGGPIYSKLAVIQLVPTAALQVTDRLSVGFAPTITMAEASLDPNFLGAPDFIGSAPVYASATHSRTHWGLGFQVGLYYELETVRLGASYKSPQWFEEFTFFDTSPTGVPRTDRSYIDYPGIISVGAAYYGMPRLIWAVDLRYIDYENAELFGEDASLDATGALSGLGWQSVFAVSTGVQYQLSDALALRAGYLYNQNPIADQDAFFNAASPAIYEHIVSVGATLQVSCRTSLSVAYLHAFENSIEGPGLFPGSRVGTTLAINALVAGLQVRF
jgi:long-chain fatty acid transport protein